MEVRDSSGTRAAWPRSETHRTGLAAGAYLPPYLYALSKIMWANMFFSYQGVGKAQ